MEQKRNYTNQDCMEFVDAMAQQDYEIKHYKGRNSYEGPAVYTDNLSRALRQAGVECSWDSMGRGYVVHPKESDSGEQ